MAASRLLDHAVDEKVHRYRRINPCDQAENPFANLVSDQSIAVIPSFRLESGATLLEAPVAYRSYGTLAPDRSNVIVICHAFTGNADVREWWNPLLSSGGKGNGALDLSLFYVICMNCLGSPYGSASPVTAINGDAANGCYGPTFPPTTIRDDVRLFRLLLDDLGVRQVAAVIGGSMGGMHVLEFAYLGPQYVRTIIPIATTAQSSAWSISWSEAQRQNIFSDCKYDLGHYDFDNPPASGLGAARMAALLTYRSRDSLEDRFGRRKCVSRQADRYSDTCRSQGVARGRHFFAHNEGHRSNPSLDLPTTQDQRCTDEDLPDRETKQSGHHFEVFSAQSYLRYQSDKFVKRFDANCYIAITRKIDTHDVARDRASTTRAALAMIKQPTLVLGIPSDGLFTYQEQRDIAAMIPNAQLKTIHSPDGHDGFLLEYDQINRFLKDFIHRELADIAMTQPLLPSLCGLAYFRYKAL